MGCGKGLEEGRGRGIWEGSVLAGGLGTVGGGEGGVGGRGCVVGVAGGGALGVELIGCVCSGGYAVSVMM